jgi:small subunit ribosomal protein S9
MNKDLEFFKKFQIISKNKYWHATGRRKESSVNARIIEGTGKIIINGLSPSNYFCKPDASDIILESAKLLGLDKKFDYSLLAKGGGITGQLDASRLAIAKVLLKNNPENSTTLKKSGFLTRDSRKVERKKPGLKKARRAPQWNKR